MGSLKMFVSSWLISMSMSMFMTNSVRANKAATFLEIPTITEFRDLTAITQGELLTIP